MSSRSRRRSGTRSGGGRSCPSLPRRILNAAERWKAGRDFDLPYMDPAFDATLNQVLDGVERRLGHEVFEFLGDLNFEASTSLEVLEDPNGRLVTHCATLFVIPIVGPRSEIHELVSDPERMSALSSSFRTSGLFHETSRCLLLPHLVDPTGLVSMTPGRLHQLTSHLGHSILKLANGEPDDPDLADMVASLIDIDPDEGNEGEIIPRAIVGVRSYVWDEELDIDDWPSDFLNVFDPDEDESVSKFLEGWFTSTVGPLSERGITIEMPSYWTMAIGEVAYLHLTIQLSVSRLIQEIDPSTEADFVHVHVGDDSLWVATEIKGSGIFGPVAIPNLMTAYDRETFEERISSLGREFVVHYTQATFNAMFGTRH